VSSFFGLRIYKYSVFVSRNLVRNMGNALIRIYYRSVLKNRL
jgi:hypothetical protein